MSFTITPAIGCGSLQFVDTTGIYGATADTVYGIDPLNGSGYNGTGAANIALADVEQAILAYASDDLSVLGTIFSGTTWLPALTAHFYLRLSAISASNTFNLSVDGNVLFGLALSNIDSDLDTGCAEIVDAINAYVATTGAQWQAQYLGSGIIHVWSLTVTGEDGDGLTVTVTQTGITHTSDTATVGSGNGTGMTYTMPPLSDGAYTFTLTLYDADGVVLHQETVNYLHTCNVEKCLAEAVIRKAKSDCGCGGGCSGCAGADKLSWVFSQLWALKVQHANGVYACVHEVASKLLKQCQNLCKDC